MRITSKGQVTIPKTIRDQTGLKPHTEFEFRVEDDRVILEKVDRTFVRDEMLIDHMRGAATISLTTDEIMRLTRP